MEEYRKKNDEDFKKNAVNLSYASQKSVKESDRYDDLHACGQRNHRRGHI